MSKDLDYIADLERENAELKELKKKKEEIEIMTNFCKTCKKMHTDQLTKARELLNEFMRISKASDEVFEHDYSELIGATEQFLKEIEK